MNVVKLQARKTDIVFQIQIVLTTKAATTYRNGENEDTNSLKELN